MANQNATSYIAPIPMFVFDEVESAANSACHGNWKLVLGLID